MKLEQQTHAHANGSLLTRYSYYVSKKGKVVHGFYESYHDDGRIRIKGFARHRFSIGLVMQEKFII